MATSRATASGQFAGTTVSHPPGWYTGCSAQDAVGRWFAICRCPKWTARHPWSLALLLLVLEGSTSVAAGRHMAALCRRSCKATVTACMVSTGQRRVACKRQILRRCRRAGLQVCGIGGTTTTTTTTTTATTTTTTAAASVTLRVNNSSPVTCDGNDPAVAVHLTICAKGAATVLDLFASDFTLTQSGITYAYSLCTYDVLRDPCTEVSLASPTCYSCGLVFEFADDGSPRMLKYEGEFPTQVTF